MGCGTPTLVAPSHDSASVGLLGNYDYIFIDEFSSDAPSGCTIQYSTSVASSQDTAWLTLLTHGRGIYWDSTDNDSAKLGDYTLTIEAKIGCSTETTTIVFSLSDCSGSVLTIDSAILPSLSIDYTLWGYSDDTFALDSSYVSSTAEAG